MGFSASYSRKNSITQRRRLIPWRRLSWCVHARVRTSENQSARKRGSGSQIKRTVRVPPRASLANQPGGVKNAIPIKARTTAGRESFQIDNPIQTPRAAASAFQPRKPKKGNACSRIGATVLLISSNKAKRSTSLFPDRKVLAEPGLPSPNNGTVPDYAFFNALITWSAASLPVNMEIGKPAGL